MSTSHGRRLAGVLLLTVGILLLIDRVGDIATLADVVRVWWPAGLAAYALVNLATFLHVPGLASSPIRWPLLASAVLLLVAGLALLSTTGVMRFGWASYAFPIALIAAGLLLTLSDGRWERQFQQSVSVTAVLRRKVRHVAAKNVYHVRVYALLGDVQLDLSKSTLFGRVEVHATVWRGRIHLRFAPDWPVEVREPVGPGIEIEDSRPPAGRPLPGPEPRQHLAVHTMGGHGRVSLSFAAGPPESSSFFG